MRSFLPSLAEPTTEYSITMSKSLLFFAFGATVISPRSASPACSESKMDDVAAGVDAYIDCVDIGKVENGLLPICSQNEQKRS